MTGLLERGGFAVERGISGFPIAFLATYGSGAPVIAFHTEYDANPDNSQAAGVAEHKPIVAGAPGHCEGHNVNAAVMVASALAVKRAMDEFSLKGTLKVFRSEEHTSELQSLMRISYAVFCFKKKINH